MKQIYSWKQLTLTVRWKYHRDDDYTQ